MNLTRRSAMKAGLGAAALATLPGCSDPPLPSAPGGESRTVHAAFFTLWDWTEQVAGDEFAVENPVPVGQMGHGFEPPGDLTRDIATAEAFVYLDTPEFSWAQNVADELEREYQDVAVIDGLAGFGPDQLLAFDGAGDREPDRDHDWDPRTVEIAEFDVIDGNTGGVAAYWHQDHWHGGLPDVPVDGRITLGAVFEDDAGRVLPLGPDEPFQFGARLADGAPEGHVEIESLGDEVRITGRDPGRTIVVLELRHDGDVLWDTSADPLNLDVLEDREAVEVDEFFDPHVWVDPVLAGDVIENIVDGLTDLDSDRAETYADNAAAYRTELEALDETFEALVEDAERTTAVFAGHDSFRYLEHRYGFELHSPAGVSPDASPSQSEIAETIDLIEAEGIDTILYDPFETPDPESDVPDLAQTLLENSAATDVAPLSPAEGTTGEWNDRGWGWLEQMRELNVPSLSAALGANP